MKWAFVNGWKRYKIYDESWATAFYVIDLSIFHIPAKKHIGLRFGLLGFSIEVSL